MPRAQPKGNRLPRWWHSASGQGGRRGDTELPPLEAFSFQGFMADIQAQAGESGGVGADLDRIAEICARSRYSLSNRYEAHLTPHGSGAAFLGGETAPSTTTGNMGDGYSRSTGGGTSPLAASSDDESAARTYIKRRSGARRRNGTLETIMSSSRSSEEDKTRKKAAAEMAGDVRDRTPRDARGHPGGLGSSGSGSAGNWGSRRGTPRSGGPGENIASSEAVTKLAAKKPASFASAVMGSTRGGAGAGDTPSARRPATALVGEPAAPETSRGLLEIRRAPPEEPSAAEADARPQSQRTAGRPGAVARPPGPAAAPVTRTAAAGWDAWLPRRGPASGPYILSPGRGLSYAEGSLRQLLKSAEAKDEGVPVGSRSSPPAQPLV